MQILPGVYQLNGPFCGQTNNGYLVQTDQVTIMIDSGDSDADVFDLVSRNAARWGIALADVDYMLLTHAHYDHSTHAARLQRLGVKLVGNQACAEALASGDERTVIYQIHRPFETCQLDLIVADGQTLTLGDLTIDCLALPGHAQSCMGYLIHLRGERLLFVGDVIKVGNQAQEVLTGWAGSPDYDRTAYLSTLRKLAFMPSDHLFPGHGPACIGRGQAICEMIYGQTMVDWVDYRQ